MIKKFVFKKIKSVIPTLIGISIIAFALPRMVPGDPVQLLIGERGADPAVYQEFRERLGLDKPLVVQYFHYIGGVFTGDFGTSITSQEPVLDEFVSRFPATLELSFFALLFATLIGIPLGIIAAVKRSTFWDYSIMTSALFGFSMPVFWWGLMLIIVFSTTLDLTPVSGRLSVFYEVPSITGFNLIDSFYSDEWWGALKSSLHHLILPAFALGTIPLAVIARMTRSSILEVLNEDYIRTAKAKGLPYIKVVMKHAFRNALVPIVTVIGLMVGTLVTGAILTESIFSWPGIGRWFVSGLFAKDYPVLQGGTLLISFIIIFVNNSVDFIYMLINPRMRDL